jgi:hypothetical protein
MRDCHDRDNAESRKSGFHFREVPARVGRPDYPHNFPMAVLPAGE